jgi:hypothetical protein
MQRKLDKMEIDGVMVDYEFNEAACAGIVMADGTAVWMIQAKDFEDFRRQIAERLRPKGDE